MATSLNRIKPVELFSGFIGLVMAGKRLFSAVLCRIKALFAAMPTQITQQQALALLSQTLGSYIQLTPTEFDIIAKRITFRHFEKGELLTAEGEIDQYLNFIIDGVTRSFFFQHDNEISLEFFFPGSFITSYISFYTQIPSAHAIEAFTPLTCLRIRRDDFLLIEQEFPQLHKLTQHFSGMMFRKNADRVRDLLSLSATERYQKLLEAHPQYVREIPLKYLASYLNITPESLSRIRKSLP